MDIQVYIKNLEYILLSEVGLQYIIITIMMMRMIIMKRDIVIPSTYLDMNENVMKLLHRIPGSNQSLLLLQWSVSLCILERTAMAEAHRSVLDFFIEAFLQLASPLNETLQVFNHIHIHIHTLS